MDRIDWRILRYIGEEPSISKLSNRLFITQPAVSYRLKKMEEEGCRITEEGTRLSLTRDSAGYVVFVDCGGKRLEGERFRTLFGLASANFQIREKGENIIFVTKGIGHGLGFDQYAADLLAAEGKDYQQLLAFFFQGISLEKVE